MKTTDLKIDLLRSVPGFADLSERQLARYAPLFDEVKVAAGMVLAREGEVGRELVVIVEGRATLERRGAASEVLGPGAFVGETAILGEVPHWSSVVTRTPMRLLVAGRESFRALGSDPDLLRRVAATLATRLRAAPDPHGTAALRSAPAPPVRAGAAPTFA